MYQTKILYDSNFKSVITRWFPRNKDPKRVATTPARPRSMDTRCASNFGTTTVHFPSRHAKTTTNLSLSISTTYLKDVGKKGDCMQQEIQRRVCLPVCGVEDCQTAHHNNDRFLFRHGTTRFRVHT
eukprot:scaffold1147_cov172-Amphora_coffeaeformis.AAC.19